MNFVTTFKKSCLRSGRIYGTSEAIEDLFKYINSFSKMASMVDFKFLTDNYQNNHFSHA